MKVQRGDVVLLSIAFTTGTGMKMRPAVVVQSDHNNVRLNATIVAMILLIEDR
jgi:mRNA-degrading endonuclease toxin of MazEF toxin-antitoxin module